MALCEWPPWRAVEIWHRSCGKNLRVSRSWATHTALLQQLYLLSQRELLARGTLTIHPLEINSTLIPSRADAASPAFQGAFFIPKV